jgi:hypothetical protein
MSLTSTTEKLLLYFFNETDMSDSVLIQRGIDYDPEVEAEFENIKLAFEYLDAALMEPSPRCINAIMAYAFHS